MQDATNYLTNLDKPLEEQRFLLSVSYRELWAIKGLAQNTHPAHEDNEELTKCRKSLFEGSKLILEHNYQARLNAAGEDNISTDSDLDQLVERERREAGDI